MQIMMDGITKTVIEHFEKIFKSSKKTYREVGTQTTRYALNNLKKVIRQINLLRKFLSKTI